MLASPVISIAARSSVRSLRSPALMGIGGQPVFALRYMSTSPARAPQPSKQQHQQSRPAAISTEANQAEQRDRDVVYGEKHPKGSYLLFHPVYSESDLDAVKVVYRDSKTIGDRIAAFMCWFARSVFDIATRYPSHDGKKFPKVKQQVEKKVELPTILAGQKSRLEDTSKDGAVVQSSQDSRVDPRDREEGMTLQEMRSKGLVFGPDQWLNRMIFLETIAGVPGMVAASCRHLQSLRLMKRDQGWIHTMLEDAENERMHLLTFMTIAKPGIIARTFALLAQGVFYNFFFVLYLAAPKVGHRFVGKLEEEAVYTYSLILEDMENGRLPEWEDLAAPEIAKEYWQLAPDAKFYDVVRAIRADEATHRHINHTFASLESTDPNPFAANDLPAKMRGEAYGFEREQALEWAKRGKETKSTERTA